MSIYLAGHPPTRTRMEIRFLERSTDELELIVSWPSKDTKGYMSAVSIILATKDLAKAIQLAEEERDEHVKRYSPRVDSPEARSREYESPLDRAIYHAEMELREMFGISRTEPIRDKRIAEEIRHIREARFVREVSYISDRLKEKYVRAISEEARRIKSDHMEDETIFTDWDFTKER